jgi:hypothetical protein
MPRTRSTRQRERLCWSRLHAATSTRRFDWLRFRQALAARRRVGVTRARPQLRRPTSAAQLWPELAKLERAAVVRAAQTSLVHRAMLVRPAACVAPRSAMRLPTKAQLTRTISSTETHRNCVTAVGGFTASISLALQFAAASAAEPVATSPPPPVSAQSELRATAPDFVPAGPTASPPAHASARAVEVEGLAEVPSANSWQLLLSLPFSSRTHCVDALPCWSVSQLTERALAMLPAALSQGRTPQAAYWMHAGRCIAGADARVLAELGGLSDGDCLKLSFIRIAGSSLNEGLAGGSQAPAPPTVNQSIERLKFAAKGSFKGLCCAQQRIGVLRC